MAKSVADLPLHTGTVPPWLAARMIKLAKIVVRLVAEEYGTVGFLERISDPIWFQALNNLIGMDWDSSGSTTVICGILKQVLSSEDLDVSAAGGKGSRSRETPRELKKICSDYGLDPQEYIMASRLVAKIDNNALQCGYTLYHHMFFVDREGNWAVVQQGMNLANRMARRYHWFSGCLNDFIVEPHKAISGIKHSYALNTIARKIGEFRKTVVDLAKEPVSKLERDLKSVLALARGNTPLAYYTPYTIEEAKNKVRKYESLGPVSLNKIALNKARELAVADFKELLLVKGLGPSTLRALALVAELVYETPPSWKDPVTHPVDPFKYAYAVGGKDGVPFPVDKKTYDELLSFLETLLTKARDHRKIFLRNIAKITKNWTPPPEDKIPT